MKKIKICILSMFLILFNVQSIFALSSQHGELVDKNKVWYINFSQNVLEKSIKDNIKIVDKNNNKVNHDVDIAFVKENHKTLLIFPPMNGYQSGEKYRIIILPSLESENGENIKEKIEYEFEIKNDLNSEIITFKDKNLEKAIKNRLNKTLENNLTKEKIEAITIFSYDVSYDEMQIKSLEGIEKLINLEYVCINCNSINDLTPLLKLKKLQKLKLLEISNLDVINQLINLEKLEISVSQINDINFLSNLNNLNYLDLTNNQITDLTPLENLSKLKELNLAYNNITNINSLNNLNNLTTC